MAKKVFPFPRSVKKTSGETINMMLTQEQIDIIRSGAEYVEGDSQAWLKDLIEMMKCFPTDAYIIRNIVSYDRDQRYPKFLMNSLCSFASYVHQTQKWVDWVSASVLGQIYYDYLEQLCDISSVVLMEYLFVSGKELSDLEESGFLSLLLKYPVWARKVVELTSQWCAFMEEMLTRVLKDMPEEKIVRLTPIGSDSHNHNRRVCLLEMDKGRKVLYKPHSLDTDEVWEEICRWIMCHTGIQIPYLHAENYGNYGYVPYISYCSPKPESYPEFFYHAGILLCVVYWLQGSDMHYENVIAHGEWPYLVDLEILTGEKEKFQVMDTAMLRLPIYKEGNMVDDYGAFTNKNPEWNCLPKEGSLVITAADYPEEICKGFEDMYHLLMECDRSDIGHIVTCSPRYVFRSTSYYTALINRLKMTDMLIDGVKYYKEINRSLGKWFEHKDSTIMDSEIESILRNDVPIFYHYKESRDLYNEKEMIQSNYFHGIPGTVLHRELSEKDLIKQLALIRIGIENE